MSNVTDNLREMAKNGATTKQISGQMAAVVADMSDDIGEIKTSLKAQETFNSDIDAEVKINTTARKNYNKGLWMFGFGGASWMLYEVLSRIFQ